MSNKELKTRIQMKNDTPEHWDAASQNGFIPLLGEPIFYRDNNDTVYGVKLGDGKNTPNDLPFLHGMISENNTTVLTNQDLQILFAQEGSKFLKSSEFSTAGAGAEFISLVDLNVNKTYSAFGQFGEFGLLFYNDGEWQLPYGYFSFKWDDESQGMVEVKTTWITEVKTDLYEGIRVPYLQTSLENGILQILDQESMTLYPVATKKDLENLDINLPIEGNGTNTVQKNYSHTLTGDANAIFGKGTTTVIGSGNLLAGHQGSKNITGSGNIVVGNGGTDYLRRGESGESVGNLMIGSGLDVTGSYNLIDGSSHLVNGTYNIISGKNHEIEGNYNVITGTGEFADVKTKVNGKANFVSGDFSNSSIVGNYNSIINGGGDNTITGTESDKAQHNMIIGSTTTITNSENCLSLGRLNTINNHNRSVLMGLGLTATRDNQLIVGSYNDESKTGGILVVGGGSTNEHKNAMIVYKEGTVTIGSDPIGDMDVATKHYVDQKHIYATEEDINSLFDAKINFDVLYCTNRFEYSYPANGTNWGGGNGVVRLSLGPGVVVDNNQWKATLYGYRNESYGPVVSTISRGGVAEIDFEEKYDIFINASGYTCCAVVEFSINGVQYTETTDAVYYP